MEKKVAGSQVVQFDHTDDPPQVVCYMTAVVGMVGSQAVVFEHAVDFLHIPDVEGIQPHQH